MFFAKLSVKANLSTLSKLEKYSFYLAFITTEEALSFFSLKPDDPSQNQKSMRDNGASCNYIYV